MSLEKASELKRRISKLKSEAHRSTGYLDGLMSRLRDEFGVESVGEALKVLKDLKRRESRLSKQVAEKLEAFERKWDG